MPGRRVAVGTGATSWDFSPDASFLVLARHVENRTSVSASLQFVDVRRMRALGRVRLGSGDIRGLVWLDADRLLAVRANCCTSGATVFVVDAARRRVLDTRSLDGQLLRVGAAAEGLVLLTAPDELGAARLVFLDGAGAPRSITLDRIAAGYDYPDGPEGPDEVVRAIEPGLAVDADAGTAYVVPAAGDLAAVELASGAVSYRTLRAPSSRLQRFLSWLEPTAQAKVLEGSSRFATYLGNDLIALTGVNYIRGERRTVVEPAGLAVVEAGSGVSRKLDDQATSVVQADGLLLAPGPDGLAAYGSDGGRRFAVLPGKAVYVAEAVGGRAYVGVEPQSGRRFLKMIDLASGRVLGERRAELPKLLLTTPR
jgi:hypothetical protein